MPKTREEQLAELDREEQDCRDMFNSRDIDGRYAATWQAEIDQRRKDLQKEADNA